MHLGSTKKFKKALCILGTVVVWAFPPSLSQGESPNFHEVVETKSSELLALSNTEESISLFKEKFGVTLGLQKKRRRATKNIEDVKVPPEFIHEISQIMASLTLSSWALVIQKTVQTKGPPALAPFLHHESEPPPWFLEKAKVPTLAATSSLASTLVGLLNEKSGEVEVPFQYEVYAHYLDHTYPVMTGSPDSWVTLVEDNGMQVIHSRLTEFWTTPEGKGVLPTMEPSSPQKKNSYGTRYIQTRLGPVLTARLIARTIKLRAEGEEQAYQSWNRLKALNKAQHQSLALGRLCGTWQWLVHNHQNHQDHKMSLSLSSPSTSIPGQPQPSQIIINGDTVYLRWDFPTGFQEDSLLLSNRDNRLEGTFKSSAGPHGRITGRRLTRCRPD